MEKIVAGTFKSTAADIYLCLGFIPDWVKLINLTDAANNYIAYWSKHDRSLAFYEGQEETQGVPAEKGAGVGIKPYVGGDVLTALSTVYLAADPSPDKRAVGTGSAITTWKTDTPGNITGHWNDVCDTSAASPVGVGSRIRINGKEYLVTVMSSNGEQADEVTLDRLPPSADTRIDFLGGIYDFIGMASGKTTLAGVKIDVTIECIATASELVRFEAGCYL